MSVAARFLFVVVVPITAVGGDGSLSFVFSRPMTRSPSLNAARLNCSSNDTSRDSRGGGVGGDRRRWWSCAVRGLQLSSSSGGSIFQPSQRLKNITIAMTILYVILLLLSYCRTCTCPIGATAAVGVTDERKSRLKKWPHDTVGQSNRFSILCYIYLPIGSMATVYYTSRSLSTSTLYNPLPSPPLSTTHRVTHARTHHYFFYTITPPARA